MSETTKINTGKTNDYRSLKNIRQAYRKGDIEMSMREHHKSFVHDEEHSSIVSEYIKPFVFGGLDGIMTTFSIVAAAVGSNSSYVTILIFGFSNVLADGFSMGFGEYISGDAEVENALAERSREEWEVNNVFEMEVDEMVQLYESKGLSQEDAAAIVQIISKDPKLFVDFMMREELGILVDLNDINAPKKRGVAMFFSFIIFGSFPLLAYLFGKGKGVDIVFAISCILASCALLVLGLLKGYLAGVSMIRSASLMLFNGIVSGLVSYSAGWAIESVLRAEFGNNE